MKVSDIINSVKEISKKHNIELKTNVFKCIELTSEIEDVSKNWEKFEGGTGVYCFIKANEKEIIYRLNYINNIYFCRKH